MFHENFFNSKFLLTNFLPSVHSHVYMLLKVNNNEPLVHKSVSNALMNLKCSNIAISIVNKQMKMHEMYV